MIHQFYKPTINDFEDNIALENGHFNNNLLTTDPIAFHNLVSYELFENIITAYTSDL
ncbi:guanosine-3',5'-bis(diphosphate) 3'-pyrophosphohydrolase [Bacillus toyonensis]|uniref:Guanosine-3',5'-bis(Diphosphate) 3'-pyrophosphohydrolase n=1 Tax=Bacillus toyonensis TaxID=155322 RepID=A0AAP8F5H8_9BACI|nr:guanosine-3',5'-bis(diphosphate) 3'-pyrophosphohydrolase [Bacillus toyonensis]MBH0358070.1 guanosine-3',5'-bis(diphosphate) 3'-pyrophosphohydrolase [Bacillus toyonensis biovar Thuringiensis]MBY7136142.1 guanosine-3',5'-bis(diphosphate) 3'-pyrophosphohydrolase [Bacillus sp. 12RED03]QEQ20201.1 guanosine-3',5'-bis(diphosphate) 3'-pyrophosphohydrolase [Bacillus sp. BS98]MBC2683988.1 guanosine-3',5'-bis(diphosphate) 3'-pyrophosphohydrolase [Bacillus toyonensis]